MGIGKLSGAVLLLAAAPAAGREADKVVMPTEPAALAQQMQYGYADAVIAGDKVYLSGVIAAPRPGERGCNRRMNGRSPRSARLWRAPGWGGTMSSI